MGEKPSGSRLEVRCLLQDLDRGGKKKKRKGKLRWSVLVMPRCRWDIVLTAEGAAMHDGWPIHLCAAGGGGCSHFADTRPTTDGGRCAGNPEHLGQPVKPAPGIISKKALISLSLPVKKRGKAPGGLSPG